MRNPNRNNQVDGGDVLEARLDLIAESGFAAVRVGNDEEPSFVVDGDQPSLSADADARDDKRRQRAQAKDDQRRDREATQPSGGGSTANAVTSAPATRTAVIEAKISTTFALAPQLRT